MKFDTPATTNPIDQLKVVGKPDRPHRRPAQDHRHGALRLRAARRRAEPGLRLRGRRRPSPRAASPPWTWQAAKAAPGVLAIVTTLDMPASWSKGTMQHRLAVRRARDPALPPGDRARGRRDLRAGARRRAPDPRRLRRASRASSTSPPRPGRAARAATAAKAAGRPEDRGRRLRGRLRRRAGQARRDLHHARPEPRHDGAARHHRRVGGRQAHALDLEPDGRLGQSGRRQDARHPDGERPPDLALHRRRLRRQAVRPRRRRAGGARRARGQAAGEGGAHAAADGQQHHPPPGDDPAHPHRRDARRQDHGDRARELARATCRAASPETAVDADAAALRRARTA